jgi:hypothetical protein
MVRRNELACRDEWSRSLWQPREGHHSNGDLPFQRPTSGPLPPTLAENLRSVLNHDMALAASSQGEDVLLSEARIISEPQEPWEPQSRPFPVGNFDPRTAIFRAREAYRERVRAKAAAERLSAGVEAASGSPAAGELAAGPAKETAVDAGDPGPHEGGAATGKFQVQVPQADSWLSDLIEAESQEAELALPAVAEPSGNAAIREPLAVANEAQLEEPEKEWRPTAAGRDSSGPATASAEVIEEVDFANRLAGLEEREALPEWYRADLPRICRTCRDYRPSTEGQRGWCANAWAFTHRRLVLEDDPAPCQSAIGDWWLPVDDVWLVAADVSSHGRATPLLDRLTAKAEQQRRRS